MGQNASTELWLEMRQTTEQILGLSVEDEEFEQKLEQLQTQQIKLRDAINLTVTEQGAANNPLNRKLIEECMQLEREVQMKFTAYQLELSSEIRLLQNASKARNNYQKVYSQYDGYFIDKHN